MTERKPVDMTIESWVDRQVRVATERGDFDDLPGAGKPIPPSRADDGLGWIRRKLESEGLTTDALLPMSLQLRREIDQLPRALARIDPRASGAEDEARRLIGDLNRRIAAWLRTPSPPVIPISPVDAGRFLSSWRSPSDETSPPATQPTDRLEDLIKSETEDNDTENTDAAASGRADSAGDAGDGVVVYWRPGCIFCQRLRTVLWTKRLRPTMINIWKDPDAAAFVRSVADGNETVPTVVIDGKAHVNPAPRTVVAALRRA